MTLVGGTAPGTALHANSSSARRGRDVRPSFTSRPWPAVYGAALGSILFAVARNSMPDDALIHAAYARNLIEHGEWALSGGIPANTATSPLWVWLLAATGGILGSVIAGGALLLAACLGALSVALDRLGGPRAAVLGTLLITVTPVMSSAVGMETFLAVTLLVWLVERAFSDHVLTAGVLVGALILTRPDLVAAAGVVVGLACWATHRWRSASAMLLGTAIATPWWAFSWLRLGSAWPDTVPLKSELGGWNGDTVHLWNCLPLYVHLWPAATCLTVVVVIIGFVALVLAGQRRRVAPAALALSGIVDVVFIAASGGPPATYYAAPAICGLGLCSVLIGVESRIGWIPVASVTALTIAFAVQFSGWSVGSAPMRANFATNPEYARIADELPRDGLIVNRGEIGALAFYCRDRGCRVVDTLLADPAGTDVYVDRWRSTHPWAESNYAFRSPPGVLAPRYQLTYSERPAADSRPVAVWPITGADGSARVAVLTRLP